MSESRSPLNAQPVVGSTVECQSYRPGRICHANGCLTVLSIYNPSSLCSVHERMQADALGRARRFLPR